MRRDLAPVTFEHVDLTDGFFAEKQKLVREVSTWNVFKRFSETGRFAAARFEWKEGDPNPPHIFFDSDVAKWMEAVAYLTEKKREPEMEKEVDAVVDAYEAHRMADGYINSYYEVMEPENRFTVRANHELYCAGHLLEAAIAYKRATGKDKFLRLMIDYMDLVYRVFYVEKSAAFTAPGHEEIELALVKLYRETGDRKYLDLALYFVDQRGVDLDTPYAQDQAPVRKQTTAEGHSVRLCYLYCAVADLARETGDEELFAAARRIYASIVERRMYVTGAIGQTYVGEAFMEDYDLPNGTAYAETCANLSLAMFSRRMSLLDPDGTYADTVERVLYNSFISGVSLDGKSFFYSNMQENDLHVRRRMYSKKHVIFCPADTRVEVFNCSCCPPNVVRTIASVADFMYMTDGKTVFMNQYFASHAAFDGRELTVKTEYPYDGTVRVSYRGKAGKLALRIPGWCASYTLAVNGAAVTGELRKGYLYVDVKDGDELTLTLAMPVSFVQAHPRVWEDAGRVAVTRGPLVYCMEGIDHKDVPLRDIRLSEDADYKTEIDPTLGVPVLTVTGAVRAWEPNTLYGKSKGYLPCPVRLIPYFAFANRGETDLIIWTLEK